MKSGMTSFAVISLLGLNRYVLTKNVAPLQLLKKKVLCQISLLSLHHLTSCSLLSRCYCNLALPSLKTMKLETTEFKQLFTPELNFLVEVFRKYGYELRIAGGAVRDLLMNKKPEDVDFASTATPEQMKDMFNAEKLRMINNRGEKHGTVTVRVNDKEHFEVTTLRIDVLTDGRHAEVEFTTDWQLDASRRDLTINSMFLGFDGTVYDYYNGVEDLKKKRIVFVGDPDTRICEDYLRILRYFRFYGRIAEETDSHELATINAIKKNCAGLAGVSGERIWLELKKILGGKHIVPLMRKMIEVGLPPHIGIPANPQMERFSVVHARAKPLSPQPVTLLTSLLKNEEQMMNLHGRLKLSAYERDLGLFLIAHREGQPHPKPLRPYQLLLLDCKGSGKAVYDWICELFKYRGDEQLLSEFRAMQLPKFPINGNMLKDKGIVLKGKQFNEVLRKLRERWVESEFSLTKDELLEQVNTVMKEIPVKT